MIGGAEDDEDDARDDELEEAAAASGTGEDTERVPGGDATSEEGMGVEGACR